MSVVSPALTLLLAPTGQLSGDGQLRELMAERRSHTGVMPRCDFCRPPCCRSGPPRCRQAQA
jgi:hypothetical protein